MGSFFNLFNNNHRKCFHEVIKNKIKIHSSIYYPGSALFLKKLTSNRERKEIDLIIKIAGYNFDQFRYELDKSVAAFDIEDFYGIQFWDEVPFNSQKKIDYIELEKIIKYLEDLKNKKFVKKLFLQIRPGQHKLEETKLLNFFDGFAFYAYPNEAQLDIDNFNCILKNKKTFLQMQFFGGRYKKNLRENFLNNNNDKEQEKNWIKKCIHYSVNNFDDNLLFVGSTRKLHRLKFLIENLKTYNYENCERTRFSKDCLILSERDYNIDTHKKNLTILTSNIYLFKQYLIRFLKLILIKKK